MERLRQNCNSILDFSFKLLTVIAFSIKTKQLSCDIMESCCCKMTLSTCQSSDSTFDDDSNETDSLSQGTSKTTLQTYDNCSDDSCYCWSLFLFESHKKRGISAYNNPKLSDFLCFWSNETIDVENIDNNFLKSILVRLSQNMAEKRLSFVHEIYPKLEIPTEIVDEIVSFELGPGVSKVCKD